MMNSIQILVDLGLSPTSIDEDLFLQALTHKSYAMDYALGEVKHNERLEFLGDSILGAVIAKLIYSNFPDLPESQLTLTKIFLVKEGTLATVARNISLGSYMRLGVGEGRSGGHDKDSVLSDGLEALIAYVYIQYGREIVETFIHDYVYVLLGNEPVMPQKSGKNQLQERVQKLHNELPVYKDFASEHDSSGDVTMFGSKVYVREELRGEGYGRNKKRAQEAAAQQAMENIT